MAGATQLAGTKSGTASGADVCAREKGDGAVTAVGMVWEASQSQEQGWERCQELASSQLAASTP